MPLPADCNRAFSCENENEHLYYGSCLYKAHIKDGSTKARNDSTGTPANSTMPGPAQHSTSRRLTKA